jgi:hypothetical protein
MYIISDKIYQCRTIDDDLHHQISSLSQFPDGLCGQPSLDVVETGRCEAGLSSQAIIVPGFTLPRYVIQHT